MISLSVERSVTHTSQLQITLGAAYAQSLNFTNSGSQFQNASGKPLLTVAANNTAVNGFMFSAAATGGAPIKRLSAARFGFTEVLPIDRVLDAPQAKAPGKISAVAFQGLTFNLPDLPFDEPGGPELPPALLGEHSHAILAALGYDDATRAKLIADGTALVPDANRPVWAPLR